jgi:hypothetical protein
MSFLDVDRIPESMLLTKVPLSPEAAFLQDHFAYADAQTNLIATSFINRDLSTGDLHVRRLVQDNVRARMSTAHRSKKNTELP